MRLAKITCAAVLFSAFALAADDPGALVEKALKAEAHHDDKKAIALLHKADDAWQANSYARLMRNSGTVLLSVIINQQGIPTHIRLVRGLGYGLDERAAEAISTWRFRPAMTNGLAVAVQANIEINFRLL